MIRRSGRLVSVCKRPHTPRAASRLGRRAACFSDRIAKDHPHDLVILILRQDCPNLATVFETCSLLESTSATAMAHVCLNRSLSEGLITAFPPGIPCACSSPRSIVTWTPPAVQPCVRASCCSRAGDGLPGAHDRDARPQVAGRARSAARPIRGLAGGTGRQRRGIQRGRRAWRRGCGSVRSRIAGGSIRRVKGCSRDSRWATICCWWTTPVGSFAGARR